MLARFEIIALLLLVSLQWLCEGKQPHIVFIVADDLGWNDVSWNNDMVQTPHLGALASEGIVLNRSYVQPTCTPSRSAFTSAKFPFTIGRQSNALKPLKPTGLTLDVKLLPEEMKKLGYDTHAFGKWHLGFCKDAYIPTSRGFDSFVGFYGGKGDYFTHQLDDKISKKQRVKGFDFRKNESVFWDAVGKYSAFQFSESVTEVLESRDPLKPMFIYLPFQSVHAPLQAPEQYVQKYSHLRDYKRRMKLAMVTAMDDAVGEVVSSLKSTGHYDDSVIVFITDNGGPTVAGGNNYPLRGNKSTLWEGGTRAVTLIHSPLLKNKDRKIAERMIHAVDWFPTFVEMGGGTPPSDIDGVSQWKALNDPLAPDARDYFVYDIDQTRKLKAGIRLRNYKLLVGNPGAGDWTPPPENGNLYQKYQTSKRGRREKGKPIIQLFDLEDDPNEHKDVSQQHPDVVKSLLTRLDQELLRYMPKDSPAANPKGNPARFGNVWSPGWC